MSILLFLWGLIAIIYGLLVLAGSKSALHEIEAGIAFLIATVALGCGSIIEAIKDGLAKFKNNTEK